MKLKTTLILFAVFIVLFAFVYFFEIKGKGEQETDEMLVDLASEDVQKIVFKKEDETLTLQKDGEDWLITEPLEAKADKYEVDRLAEDFSKLRIERIVEDIPEDLDKYGIVQKEMILHYQDKEQPIKILIGSENPLDSTFFAKREDETRIVLIPSSLKSLMDKGLFDFRLKDVFKFETDEVRGIKLKTKEIQWRALRRDEEWYLKRPVEALAQESKINDILYSLSNMKAKEFISEKKQEEEITQYGLDAPEFEITLEMPLENKEVIFYLNKMEETVYATTSLSPKIITVEDSVFTDLEKKPEDLRDKEVADFYSWEANKVEIKRGEIDWTVAKDEEDDWHFESPVKEAAEKEKIEAFIRKIEGLEAKELIDPPLDLKDYGLDSPQAEVKIWVEEDEEKTGEVRVLIGTEDKVAKTVVVKNTRFDYLFRVNSAFLEEFPEEIKDWKKAEEPAQEKK
jgi:hypothetical protein